MRIRSLLLLIATVTFGMPVSAAFTQPAAAAQSAASHCSDDLDPTDSNDKFAKVMESRIEDMIVDGQVYEATYRTAAKCDGDVSHHYQFGDSALWTGVYLAGESMRYATLRHHCDNGSNQACAEKRRAKDRIDLMVDKFQLLINISREWKTEFNPTLEEPGFGGGIIQGEPGYLMRACLPDTPLWQNRINPRRQFGPFYWGESDRLHKGNWICEDATSRDAYAGTTFGLLTAFDMVSVDDPTMRNRIRDDLLTLAGFAEKWLWTTPRPHGRISLPIPVPGGCAICGHDFENFTSPLFVQVPMARLNIAQMAVHVARQAPGRDDLERWEAFYAEELASQLPLLALSMEVDAIQPNDGYYKYNLHHLTGYNLVRTAPNQFIRTAYKQAMSVMDKTTGDDLNAHFSALTYALTGETHRRDNALTYLNGWKSYKLRTEANVSTVNSHRCGVDFECVGRDQYELGFDANGEEVVIVVPPTNPSLRARRPLQPAERTPSDFLWQRPPTVLDGGQGPNDRSPGIDFLTPHWFLRYYTEVAPPSLEPFPEWVGPAHY